MPLNPIYKEIESRNINELEESDIRAVETCHVYEKENERQSCYEGFREGIAYSLQRTKLEPKGDDL